MCLDFQEVVPKFDDVNIDSWQRRHAVQVRFANCARKVLVQCRAQRRLEKLKSAINRGLEYFENEPKEEIPIVKPTMAPEQIVSFSFPSSDPLNEPQVRSMNFIIQLCVYMCTFACHSIHCPSDLKTELGPSASGVPIM